MHRCISQWALKSMDRPVIPLFDGRFHVIKCYLMNRIPVPRSFDFFPCGFRFSALLLDKVGSAFHYASLTSHVTVILYHAEEMPWLFHIVWRVKCEYRLYLLRLGFDIFSSEYITEIFYFVGTKEQFDGIDLQSRSA